MIRTKVCGVSNEKELEIVMCSGTDSIGFLVGQKHNAKGFISPKFANELCQKTLPFISTVIVTHYYTFNELFELSNAINSDVIQIHSDVEIDTIKKLKDSMVSQKLICKVSVKDKSSIERAKYLEDYVDGILLDSIDEKNNKVGGTGTIHDWSISSKIVSEIKKPVILAGGLNHRNINEAIKIVKPYGVDANTGLNEYGVKSPFLVNSFVKTAKQISY